MMKRMVWPGFRDFVFWDMSVGVLFALVLGLAIITLPVLWRHLCGFVSLSSLFFSTSDLSGFSW